VKVSIKPKTLVLPVAVAVLTGGLTVGGLEGVQAVASRNAMLETASIKPRATAPPACTYGVDLDTDRVRNQTQTAARAAGLQVKTLSVEKADGPGQAIVTVRFAGEGSYDPFVNFLRIGVAAIPALAPVEMYVEATDEGKLTLVMEAIATCRA